MKNNKWLALTVIILGTFMTMLDTSIVNIAIPKLMAIFNVDLKNVKWVLTGYSLALAAVIPLTGFDRHVWNEKSIHFRFIHVYSRIVVVRIIME